MIVPVILSALALTIVLFIVCLVLLFKKSKREELPKKKEENVDEKVVKDSTLDINPVIQPYLSEEEVQELHPRISEKIKENQPKVKKEENVDDFLKEHSVARKLLGEEIFNNLSELPREAQVQLLADLFKRKD